MSSDMGKLAEHKAKNPVGGVYLNTPCPLPSVLPSAVITPPNVSSCPKLKVFAPVFPILPATCH